MSLSSRLFTPSQVDLLARNACTKTTTWTNVLVRRKFSSDTLKSERLGSATKKENANIFVRFGAWYSKKLETHPLITRSVTGGIIAGTGDTICQYGTFDPSQHLDENGDEQPFWTKVWDPMRTVHFYFMGAFFASPLNYVWFNYLNRRFPGQSFSQVSSRVALDQLIWTPTWTVGWMAIFWTLEGSKPEEIPEGLKENYPTVITSNWYLWIPAQYINFFAVPAKYQVLFTNFVELIWNTYLSFVNADNDAKEAEAIPSTDSKADEDLTEEEKQKRERRTHRHETQTIHRRKTFR